MFRLLTSSEVWAKTVLKAMLQNDEGLTYHGDGDSTIFN